MKNILEKVMSDSSFKPSSVIKGSWQKDDYGVIRTISLDKSTFGLNGNKWFFAISLDFKSNYSSDPNFYNHICEASVSNGVICSRDNMRIVDHFNESDQALITSVLKSTIIPWVNNIGKPDVFIDFLVRAKSIGIEGMDAEHIRIFGDVITSLQYNPPRLRKLYDGYLATIYERIGERQKALDCLVRYKNFYDQDKAAEPAAREVVSKQIDDALQRLANDV